MRVFEQPSRNESMVVKIQNNFVTDDTLNELEKIANEFLNETVFIGWPHLTEGKVVKISTREKCCDNTKSIVNNDADVFDLEVKGIVKQ